MNEKEKQIRKEYRLKLKRAFSSKLNSLLNDKGILQIDLANYLGVTKSNISIWCNPNIDKFPSAEMSKRIAEYFGVSMDYFAYEDDKSSQEDKLVSLLNNLSDKNKKKAIEYLELLLNSQNM